MEISFPQCAHCSVPARERCCRHAGGRGPDNCPTLLHGELAANIVRQMPDDEKEFWRQSALQEATCYVCRDQGPDMRRPVKPRIVEIVEFAHRMGYQRIGLIFCGGLHKEARIVHTILETNGFETISVMCKAGGVCKSTIGIAQNEQCDVNACEETICHPAFQAALVNMAEVQFNILMGLCVGHDTIALKHIKAPATVFAVKDRVTGHNPLTPIYQYDSFYKYLKKPIC